MRFASSMAADGPRWRADPIVLTVGLVAAIVLVSYLLAMRVGVSAAVQLPGQGEMNGVLSRIMPQGWAFFTKPTLSATPVAFQQVDGRWQTVAGVPNAQLRFVAGVSREGRRQGVEMASIMNGVPKSSWVRCDGRPARECVAGSARVTSSNPLIRPTLCGEVVVAGVKPTPWEWRDLVQQRTYVHEAVKLEVRCAHT